MDLSVRHSHNWNAGLETCCARARGKFDVFEFDKQGELEAFYGEFESKIGLYSTFPDPSRVSMRRSKTRGVWTQSMSVSPTETEDVYCTCIDSGVFARHKLVWLALRLMCQREPVLYCTVLALLYGPRGPAVVGDHMFGTLARIVHLTDAVDRAREKLAPRIARCIDPTNVSARAAALEKSLLSISPQTVVRWHLEHDTPLSLGELSWADTKKARQVSRARFIADALASATQLRRDATRAYDGARKEVFSRRNRESHRECYRKESMP